MAQFIKKENLTISVGEYNDAQGNAKKQWRTIGEIVTMQGDDGQPYQFFKLWGAGGVVEGKVFSQDNQQQQQSSQQSYAPQQQQYAPQNNAQYHQQQQGGFSPQQGYQNQQNPTY